MYNIVFDAHLEHHGILGMHWGIRRYQNPDGSLTAEGRERYKVSGRDRDKIQDVVRKSEFNEDVAVKVFNIAKADKEQLSKARESVAVGVEELKGITNDTKKIFSDFNSEDTLHYYEATSEIVSFGDFYGGDVDKLDCETIAWAGYQGVIGDGQQQQINAYSLYTNKNNINDKVHSLNKKAGSIQKDMRDNCERIINKALEEVGVDDITTSKNTHYTIGSAITNRIINKATSDFDNISSGAWYLNDADYKFTENDKSNTKKAESIMSKIDNNNKTSTWIVLNGVMNDLGFSDKKASELTQSEWDQVNKLVSEYRDTKWDR